MTHGEVFKALGNRQRIKAGNGYVFLTEKSVGFMGETSGMSIRLQHVESVDIIDMPAKPTPKGIITEQNRKYVRIADDGGHIYTWLLRQ